MSALSLYDYELDENCYKVRLLLAALGLTFRKISVDMFPGAEEKAPSLLALNPTGSLPILLDDDVTLHGAEAILLYLAHHYDRSAQWLPTPPTLFGQVAMWLQFATGHCGACALARRQSLFTAEAENIGLLRQSKQALRIMDDHMTLREFDGDVWFVGKSATIADLALFPAIALSRDYGVDHEAYPALRRWMRKIRHLPGFLTMPGVPDYY
jgi:glutathione S-transferase